MIYESGYCYNKYDFLALFGAFAVKCGWMINRQNENELFLQSDDEYLNIDLQSMRISSATGYNSEVDITLQPGFIPNNMFATIGNNDSGANRFLWFENGDKMRDYMFFGNAKTLFFSIGFNEEARYYNFITKLNKTHDFSGGVLFNAYYYSILGYCHQQSEVLQNSGAANYVESFFLLGDKWNIINFSFDNIWTNLFIREPNNSAKKHILKPLQIHNLYIKKSAFSGLNSVVIPQFFYKNDIAKYVHAGNTEDIYVILCSDDLVHRQILYLGDEKFMYIEKSKITRQNQVTTNKPDTGYLLRLDS